MKFIKGICLALLFPIWVLSICLGAFGTIVASQPVWGDKCLLWGLAVVIGNIVPVCVVVFYSKKA